MIPERYDGGPMSTLMHGFPPQAAGQVTLANWRAAPFSRWGFQHVRELVPSAQIGNDPASAWELPRGTADLARLPWLGAFLRETDTDAMVVLHRGRVVLEHYAHGMRAETPHILMSVSKSLLGLLVGVLAERGVLDPQQPVSDVLPEVAATAYGGASIRQLLDMRAGIAFEEDYLATTGPIIAYRKATGWNPLEPGDEAGDLRSFYRHLGAPDGRHGGRFHYVSPNTDLLGWVIERAAGRRYADLLSELLWQPMGAAHSAYITVDRLGAPRCAGGVCTTALDLARVGQLIVQGGRRERVQVLPEAWIDDIAEGGDLEAWAAGSFAAYFPGQPIRYRSHWYVLEEAPLLLFGLGIHGQHLFVDRGQEVVIAKFSSQALPLDAAGIGSTMRAVSALRKFLAEH